MKNLDSKYSKKDKKVTQSNFLVSNETNSNTKARTFCGKQVVAGPEDDNHVYCRIFCKRYGCLICGKLKRWKIEKAIRRAIEEHKLNVFATLTIKPEDSSPENSAKYIKQVWNKHRTSQRREFKPAPSFICVVEFQKATRNAHLHVLLSRYIPFDWLDRTWRAVGGGRVHVEAADRGSARYMSKYLTKELEEKIYGKFRRVCTSRDIKLTPKKGNPDFEFLGIEYDEIHELLEDHIIETKKWGKELETGFVSDRRPHMYVGPTTLLNVSSGGLDASLEV